MVAPYIKRRRLAAAKAKAEAAAKAKAAKQGSRLLQRRKVHKPPRLRKGKFLGCKEKDSQQRGEQKMPAHATKQTRHRGGKSC